MKQKSKLQNWLTSAAASLLFIGSVVMAQAASDVTIPTDESQNSWLHAWGGAFQSVGYDAAKDALLVQAAWSGVNDDNYIVGTVAGCNGWIAVDLGLMAPCMTRLNWTSCGT